MNAAPDPAELLQRYKENPHPQQAYRVTLTIADAPGSFASFEAYATYEIQGEACLLPRDTNFDGDQLAPKRRSLPVQFTKVTDVEYVATVYADRMLDADYYGRGVCHWQSTGTHVRLKATGADGETEFIAGLSGEDLASQAKRQIFFLRRNYPTTEVRDYPDFGAERAEEYRSELRRDIFVLTVVSRKVQP